MASVGHCFDAAVADAFLRGRLAEPAFSNALVHASRCSTCRHLLHLRSRPQVDTDAQVLERIEERIRAWRAAGRVPRPLKRAFSKGEVIDRYVVIRHVGNTDDGAIYEAFDP